VNCLVNIRSVQTSPDGQFSIGANRLPAFSPDYNPIEKLWKNTKRDATHIKYFKTFEDLHDSVITTFKTYLQDASKVLCVMKKMREDFAITA